MKKIYSLIGLFLLVTQLQAKQIDLTTAIAVGKNFISSQSSSQNPQSVSSLNPVYKAKSIVNNSLTTAQETTYYFVFNNSNSGFIIVAGDDNVTPILGYADEGTFDPNNIPPNVAKWLEGYKNQIRYVIDNNVTATTEITIEWTALKNGTFKSPLKLKSTTSSSVAPLVQTKWDQAPYYNALCPSGSVTGCVATAMAQIMNYWEYPKNGIGFHSYNHSKYGTLNANFGSTTYDWANMPNSLTSSSSSAQKSAISTLMYHCGVSVDMDYSPESSGAYVISAASPVTNCAEYAFKTYFNYDKSLNGIKKINYTESEWLNILKMEFDAKRPVLYAGFGSGGHCFVADGYDSNNFIHFNWGWSGQYDGYFSINALNPSGTGIGGGSGTYTNGQQAVIGILPSDSTSPAIPKFDIRMHADLSTSQSNYWFGSSITVNAEIENHGPDSFSGELGAAVFDKNGFFVDFISLETVSGLAPNYYTSKSFTRAGGPPFIPGDYQVAIFYRTSNIGWTIVPNDYGVILDEINLANFKVYYSASIETNSSFTITNTILQQTQSATVNVDVKNTGTSTFLGKYRVSLANLDGTWAQNIQILNENNGLSPNYHYTNGNNFTGIITVSPGTYLLEIAYQKSGETTWYYAGSSNFTNPIYVTVEAPPIPADSFEPNNTQSTASNLNLSFVGDSARVTTEGSNFHIGSDLDYYQVTLPEGYNYFITARLHDSYNSANGKTYTVDATFSYSDGGLWSDNFDDVMSNPIVVKGGKTVLFGVSPYFTGQTGTYLLDLNIKRTSTTDVIITQVYGGGGNSGASYKSDFVELYNSSSFDVDISGWTLYYLGATSASTNVKYEFPTNTIIKAGKYFALKCADGTGTQPAWTINFDGTSTLALGGTAGKIILLKSNATFTLSATPTIDEIINNVNFADYVPYGTTAVPIWGSAMTSNTSSTTAAKRKFVNGKYQYTKNIGNDFEVATAEPHNSTMTVDVNPVNDDNIKVFAFNKTLFISGNSISDNIEIYNITGSMVYNSKFISNSISLSNLSSGIYIVKVGLNKFKIQL